MAAKSGDVLDLWLAQKSAVPVAVPRVSGSNFSKLGPVSASTPNLGSAWQDPWWQLPNPAASTGPGSVRSSSRHAASAAQGSAPVVQVQLAQTFTEGTPLRSPRLGPRSAAYSHSRYNISNFNVKRNQRMLLSAVGFAMMDARSEAARVRRGFI
eukprot:gnl/TRDRNA2_/TRDRNA2_189034_c0_seq1.p1 gnl/TRDRNA2_/TRDRNA2_189034_c0~~gnl/TRDRNA2_/TRDRNA2_189034_c0_seq1.p1  ORF type:complete len:174 (-),score=12.15 gnl/TRDRNA2_/TRDRNA2_189034_c0_seq1:172-633(-)